MKMRQILSAAVAATLAVGTAAQARDWNQDRGAGHQQHAQQQHAQHQQQAHVQAQPQRQWNRNTAYPRGYQQNYAQRSYAPNYQQRSYVQPQYRAYNNYAPQYRSSGYAPQYV